MPLSKKVVIWLDDALGFPKSMIISIFLLLNYTESNAVAE